MSDENEPPDPHEMTTLTPLWINKELIQKAFGTEIAKFDVSAATATGDNYNSALYRVTATWTTGRKASLLIKTPPDTESIVKDLDKAGFFSRETLMLNRLVPRMEDLLEEAAPGHYSPLAARCPHHGSTPVDFLVLEDLTAQGFVMAERRRGLGLRHCLIALRALARFHAASAALLQKDPRVAEQIGNPWRYLRTCLNSFTSSFVAASSIACRRWPGFQDHARCLEMFKDVALKMFADLQEPQPGRFNVIIHGDFWTNNMMFRYENGLPCEMRMVDLQVSNVASPTLDLLYFLSTSPTENVSRNHEDLLIREYYSALVEAMNLLGLQPPSLKGLRADMNTHGGYALFGALAVLPMVRAKMATNVKATIEGDENAGAMLFADSDVEKWLQRQLPEYRRKGWLPG